MVLNGCINVGKKILWVIIFIFVFEIIDYDVISCSSMVLECYV